jgi:thiamine-phosphate pyrophosphorylase
VNREARCRIYAVLKARPGARAQLEAALAASDVAAVLVAGGDGERPARAATADLIAAAQHADIAALILDDAQLARELGADGVHLGAQSHGIACYQDARGVLGAGAIIGADCSASRHAAMSLAEAGADYIAFGASPSGCAEARERRDALVAWWAEIFEVPCVALDVATAPEAVALRAAGADFPAVTLPCGEPDATRGLLAEIAAAILPKSTA